MPKAIRIHQTGGPEVMQWEDVDVSAPGSGEVRLRQTAIGLNYVDTYFRSGLYPLPMPAIIGSKGAGTVEAVGPDVADIQPGDRVAYAMVPGAYAEECIVPANRLVKIPDGISDQQAASMMLKGLTTQYLLRSVYRLKKGETVLFHAAAGGVGLFFGQWAKHLGAIVIGTAGGRTFRGRAFRRGENRRQSNLRTQRRGQGARGFGSAEDNGIDGAGAVIDKPIRLGTIEAGHGKSPVICRG